MMAIRARSEMLRRRSWAISWWSTCSPKRAPGTSRLKRRRRMQPSGSSGITRPDGDASARELGFEFSSQPTTAETEWRSEANRPSSERQAFAELTSRRTTAESAADGFVGASSANGARDPGAAAAGVSPAGRSQFSRARHDRAGGGVFAGVSRLSAWPGFLARHDRRHDWSTGPLRRVRKLRFPRPRPDILALGIQHDALYGRGQYPEVWVGALSRAPAQSSDAAEVAHPRRRAVAVRHADRVVGDRLLVDLRPAVLDHLLVAHQTWSHPPIH